MTAVAYRLFEVTGLELEYPIVDRDFQPRALVEEAFRVLHGRPTSEVELEGAIFSNELASHVFEIKTRRPMASLTAAEAALVEGVRAFSTVLRDRFEARLLPTGMHPWLAPHEAALWRRSGRAIYQAYAALFEIHGHGWLNVQSCHLNFPFGSEEETVRLHNAAAALLPYLPAVAASSPVYDGRLGPFVDNRMAFYRTSQTRIPQIAGRVVPEPMRSFAQYRREVLEPIYVELRRIPGAERLRHEWVNSRGAILRFNRRALEIRVLDTQECVKMDVAVAAFTRGVLRRMVETATETPGHDLLVADFERVVREGSRARVAAPHLRALVGLGGGPVPAGDLLRGLLPAAEEETPEAERPYLALVERRLANGNLSEAIRRRLEPVAAGDGTVPRDDLTALCRDLASCLDSNAPYEV